LAKDGNRKIRTIAVRFGLAPPVPAAEVAPPLWPNLKKKMDSFLRANRKQLEPGVRT